MIMDAYPSTDDISMPAFISELSAEEQAVFQAAIQRGIARANQYANSPQTQLMPAQKDLNQPVPSTVEEHTTDGQQEELTGRAAAIAATQAVRLARPPQDLTQKERFLQHQRERYASNG